MTNLSQYSGILESHYYGINGAAIKYTTRNICSDATAKILEEIAKILFPNEEIEIYVIPAKDGCHQDTFWIKNKDAIKVGVIISAFGIIIGLPIMISNLMTDSSTREMNESQIQTNQSQDELNKLQIEQIKKEMNEKVPNNNITIEQCQKLVSDYEIKKNTSRHFERLQIDGEIRKEKFVALDINKKVIDERTIESIDFPKYIQQIPETKTIKIIEKIHELTVIQPVNKKEHRDLSWYVEDPNRKIKFGVYMSDENFYKLHFENVFGLKNLIARIRYTVEEDENGEEKIAKKEIIIVYKYNDHERFKIPLNEPIEPAPLLLESSNYDDFVVLEKEIKSKKDIIHPDQMNLL